MTGSIPSFNQMIQKSIVDHWDLDSLTDFKGATLQYHDVARKIEKLHIMFESSGVAMNIALICAPVMSLYLFLILSAIVRSSLHI